MEIESAGINVGRFLYVEVINRSILLVSINTPRNGILLLILISCVKLRTELFWLGLLLWHINLCRLCNAKSIFM